jgi:hypothetical protein
MARFKDNAGAEWSIELNFGELLRIRQRSGLCLINLSAEERKADQARQDAEKLAGDLPLFVNLLFAVIEPQAIARGIDDVGFAQLLDGGVLTEAMDALQEALLVFTLSPAQKERGRQASAKRSELIRQKLEAGQEKLMQALESPAAPDLKQLQAELDAVAQTIVGDGSASGNSAANSPARLG